MQHRLRANYSTNSSTVIVRRKPFDNFKYQIVNIVYIGMTFVSRKNWIYSSFVYFLDANKHFHWLWTIWIFRLKIEISIFCFVLFFVARAQALSIAAVVVPVVTIPVITGIHLIVKQNAQHDISNNRNWEQKQKEKNLHKQIADCFHESLTHSLCVCVWMGGWCGLVLIGRERGHFSTQNIIGWWQLQRREKKTQFGQFINRNATHVQRCAHTPTDGHGRMFFELHIHTHKMQRNMCKQNTFGGLCAVENMHEWWSTSIYNLCKTFSLQRVVVDSSDDINWIPRKPSFRPSRPESTIRTYWHRFVPEVFRIEKFPLTVCCREKCKWREAEYSTATSNSISRWHDDICVTVTVTIRHTLRTPSPVVVLTDEDIKNEVSEWPIFPVDGICCATPSISILANIEKSCTKSVKKMFENIKCHRNRNLWFVNL